LCLLLLVSVSQAQEPWSTYRGTVARTGNTDNQPGPAMPKVLWTFKAQEHFVATPVPVGDTLLIAGLGAFNVSTLHALPLTATGTPTAKWSKTTPYLKLPTVSSPAIGNGRIVFGDGMHQTNGAILHSLRADGGQLVWQLPVPGNLVHLEGSPTILGGKVYLGGGAAGVLCVDAETLVLEGKTVDAVTVQRLLAERWKLLQERFEADKKKDPDFAIPPTEDALPKPSPKLLWQQGKDKWHVDAPVAVVGARVLVASAFLDKEQVGERMLACLNATDGSVLWKKPLQLNPWGGPSVAGETIVLAGSSVGYYLTQLKGAKGDLVAFDLKTGAEKWRKDVPGGVVGSVAISANVIVACATDAKVRGFDLASGERKWVYDAKFPLFAAPAVVGDVVYAADLNGVVHAIGLADGQERWKLDLGTHPAVRARGMVYGGPIVHGGKIYVATCNLEGPFVGQPTVVVAIGN
jgi:outer membrane protein assembly factor BamB